MKVFQKKQPVVTSTQKIQYVVLFEEAQIGQHIIKNGKEIWQYEETVVIIVFRGFFTIAS